VGHGRSGTKSRRAHRLDPASGSYPHRERSQGGATACRRWGQGVPKGRSRGPIERHPGKPVQNAFIEGFNGRSRDECLNDELRSIPAGWFLDLDDAREIIEAWRVDCNTGRPHSALGYATPEEFARGGQNQQPGLSP
jgi:hypothetical protein